MIEEVGADDVAVVVVVVVARPRQQPNYFDALPFPIVGMILQNLPIPEQIRVGNQVGGPFAEAFREYGPISILHPTILTELVNRNGIPEFGTFRWFPPPENALELYLTRDSRRFSSHQWASADWIIDPNIGIRSPGVLFRSKIDQLRPNGGYCSLGLRSSRAGVAVADNNYNVMEIKFDGNHLRAYGTAIQEDFGVPVGSVMNGRWFNLLIEFHWQTREVKFWVNGQLIRTGTLRDNSLDQVHCITFKGYNFNPYWQYGQAWSHIYVGRRALREI